MNSFPPSKENTALLLVDIQHDFLPPSGALAVPNGQAILPVAYRLLDPSLKWKAVIASQDYHPIRHTSFASTHSREPFTEIEVEPNKSKLQLWPEHCIQGTEGCAIEPGILERLDGLRQMDREVKIVQKGTDIAKEEYSAFKDDDNDELDDYLKAREVHNLVCIGLAADYCVRASVQSALKRGYRVLWVSSGTAAVGGPDVQKQLEEELVASSQDSSFVLVDPEEIKIFLT